MDSITGKVPEKYEELAYDPVGVEDDAPKEWNGPPSDGRRRSLKSVPLLPLLICRFWVEDNDDGEDDEDDVTPCGNPKPMASAGASEGVADGA
jgi:hypothetical protein